MPTLALAVLGVLLGVRIIRSAGLSIAEALRQKPPERGPFDAFERVLVAGAGLLLILPGFLSDLVALFVLIPSSRRWLGHKIAGRVKDATVWRPRSGQGQVIEGVTVEIEGENRQVPGHTSANPANRE